jgi:hypothetical protein
MAFNIAGYRAWFYFAEKKADSKMEAFLDKDQYKESDLIELQIPLNMPYQLEKTRFERVNGEISFNGRIYKFVKRKVSNGNLILLCIRDQNKMQIRQEKTAYGNIANDIGTAASKESSHPATHVIHTVSEYEAFFYQLRVPALLPAEKSLTISPASRLADCLIAEPGKPPKATV